MRNSKHAGAFLSVWIRGLVPFFVVLCAPLTTFAAGVVSIQPAKIEVSAMPGETITREVRVGNTTGMPIVVSVAFEDGALPDDPRDAMQLLGEAEGKFPIAALLSTPESEYVVEAGSERPILFTIRVPRDAEPGGRYGSVIFTARPEQETGSTANVAIETRLASLVFLRIEGETTEAGELGSFGVVGDKRVVRSPSEDAPLGLYLTFSNSGTVHLNPYGDIAITPMFGEPTRYVLDPWAVLPGSTRTREVPLIAPLGPGSHRLTLSLNRGYGDIIDTAEIQIWVLPTTTQFALGALIFAILAFVLYRSIRLSRNRIRT